MGLQLFVLHALLPCLSCLPEQRGGREAGTEGLSAAMMEDRARQP